VLGRFIALVPQRTCARLDRLAADCVETFETFRAPLDEDEMEQRLRCSLTPRQCQLLDRWGYPYVLDEFRFHLTLSDPLPAEILGWAQASIDRELSGDIAATLEIDAIALLRQPNGMAPFSVVETCPLGSRRGVV